MERRQRAQAPGAGGRERGGVEEVHPPLVPDLRVQEHAVAPSALTPWSDAMPRVVDASWMRKPASGVAT